MKRFLLLLFQTITIVAFGQKIHIQEDFNTGTIPTGWTTNAVSGSVSWGFGIDGNGGRPGNQNINSTAMAFFDDDILGEYSTNNTAELLSPIFDNSKDSLTYLSFDYNFREVIHLINIPDSFYVDVYDGNNWQRVFSVWQDDCGNYLHPFCKDNYPSALIDISNYANDSCQIRFTYHDGNDWSFYVGLDNVEVWSAYPNDLSVSEVLRPISTCGLLANDTIEVKVKNLGHRTQKNFDIYFELDGKTAVTETISDSIAYQDSLIYIFTNTADFSKFGTHQLKVYTTLANDSNLVNDTLSVQITNTDTIYTPPYFTDFENIDSSWSSSGTNSSWEWGVPGGTVIDTAYSGTKAWVTNVSGKYNSNESSYLTSPCFDFSNETLDPIISFSINYQTEGNYDYAWLESTVNNGRTWQKVTTSSLSNNWYNQTSPTNAWTGFNINWVKATNILSNLAGEPNVKLRFVFESDGSTHYEGVGIDDVAIIRSQKNDLGLNELRHSNDSILCGYSKNEYIILGLKNYGIATIDTFQVFYQVDNLPIDSEMVYVKLNSGSGYQHSSKNIFDFSQQKSYHLKAWVKTPGDTNFLNDTLYKTIHNSKTYSVESLPYSENFDNFSIGAANQNGWSTDPTSKSGSNFGWQSTSGHYYNRPNNDHTTGNGIYVYLENRFNSNGKTGIFESPCINFNTTNSATLSFWYHRVERNLDPLYLDFYDGIEWIGFDSITQNPQSSPNSPWAYHEVKLPFSKMTTKIRFRLFRATANYIGTIAIDDIKIEPPNLKMFNLTPTNTCGVDSLLPISVQIVNRTLNNLDADSLILSYTVNGQNTVFDTLHQKVNQGDTVYFTFKDSLDVWKHGETISIDIMNTPVDSNLFQGDAIKNIMLQQPLKFNKKNEDFESYTNNKLNDSLWSITGDWVILNDLSNNKTVLRNKTYKGKQFLYSSNTKQQDVSLESICMNSSNLDSLDLVFWYNIRGSSTSKLYIYEHSVDTNIQLIDSIVGSSPINQWQRKHINLNAYINNSMVIGFHFIDTNSNQLSSISLDDIQILEQNAPYSLRTNDLSISADHCGYSADLLLKVENIGLDSIPANAIDVYYQIDQNAAIKDSITQAIAPGSMLLHKISTPTSFNQLGKTYNIKAWAELIGDSIKTDDSLQTTYTRKSKVDSLFEDFEGFADKSCWNSSQEYEVLINGWRSNDNSWAVHNTVSCFGTSMNGPTTDHTLGNGQYIYANNLSNSKNLELFMPCIDVSAVDIPFLNYWVYSALTSMDTFKVEVFQNGSWQIIDSILGPDSSGVWKNRSVDLRAFKSISPLEIRFKGIINNSALPVLLALDDISIENTEIDPADNLKMTNLTASNSCGVDSLLPISVQIINETINSFAADSLILSYTINGKNAVFDTLRQKVNQGDTVHFTFKDSLDLWKYGEVISIDIMNAPIDSNLFWGDTLKNIKIHQPLIYKNLTEDFEPYSHNNFTDSLWLIKKDWSIINDSINNNTNLFNKTIKGKQYLQSSSNNTHDVRLESVCLNATQLDSLELIFWYNIQGAANSKLYIYEHSVDTNIQLIDSIVGSSPANLWQRKKINLNAYLNNSVVIGFHFIDTNSNQLSSISLDDIQILEQHSPYSLKTKSIAISTENCSNFAELSLKVENIGFDSIPANSIDVYYQIDQKAAIKDNIAQAIAPGDTFLYKINIPSNFNQAGKTYVIKAWTVLIGDSTKLDDSLQTNFTNNIKTDSLFEDFEGFVADSCGSNSQGSSVLINGWSTTNHSWAVHNTVSCFDSLRIGPKEDHTLGNGQYIYTNNIWKDKNFELFMPCVDISNVLSPTLSYWINTSYIATNSFKVEVFQNDNWNLIDSVYGPTYSGVWKNRTVDLTTYKSSGPVQIKFTAINKNILTPIRIALDDIVIADIKTLALNSLKINAINISTDNCGYSADLLLTLENIGYDSIPTNTINVYYQIDQNAAIKDNITQAIAPGDSLTHKINTPANFNHLGKTYAIKAWTELIGDSTRSDDSVQITFTNTTQLDSLFENFEGFADDSCWNNSQENEILINGWSSPNHSWAVHNTVNCFDSLMNGPSTDHTLGNGQYIYANNLSNQKNLELFMPCVDVSAVGTPYLSYWIHNNLLASDTFKVEMLQNGNWQLIDSVYGPDSNVIWKNRSVNITAFKSASPLEIRFIAIINNAASPVLLALDDISIADLETLAPYSLRTNNLIISTKNCDNSTELSLKVENTGLVSIPANAIKVYYQIDQNTVVQDSINQILATGDSILHKINTPATFNQPERTYAIKAWTALIGDSTKSDDSVQTTFTNQTKVDSLFEDFEGFADDSCWNNSQENEILINGWSSPNHSWAVHNTVNCFDPLMNGPSTDHTLGNGQYIYTNNFKNQKELELFMPCVDISAAATPYLSYWINAKLLASDTFKVELLQNGSWQLIDSIYGADSSGVWKSRSVNLNVFKSISPLEIRFKGIINNAASPVLLALDDISIADSLISTLKNSDKTALDNYKLYPNPSKGQFTLAVNKNLVGESYQIRDLSGRIIQEGKINKQQTRFNLNNKAKGIYIFSLPTHNIQEKVVAY